MQPGQYTMKSTSSRTVPTFLLSFLLVNLITGFVAIKASTISGRVVDQNNEPLPFTTLYIKNTTTGTTTNIEGYYSLDIAPGKYELVFQYVGYKSATKVVNVTSSDLTLNVTLQQEALQLNEVVVTADEEDPAYRVIREAIAKRKYHKEEVNAYKCQVYIKGMQTLDQKPDKIFGFAIPIDTGIVYLSESISELSFQRPNKIKEIMISSKVSGKNTAFSYNQGSQMLVSFYDNLLEAEGLSERGFVSPIANNALLFYDYKLEGVIQENDLLINKIKVIPKRKNDPVFFGYIYIIEDSWRIHSVDLTLTKEHQVEFINHLTIHQVFAPVDGDIWMMISQKFTFALDIFGFKGKGNFIGIHSNYEIEPSNAATSALPPTEVRDTIDVAQALPDDPTLNSLFPKKYFNNEILSIEKQANKRDDSYWDKVRPIPLTNIEIKDYKEKDSLQSIFESKEYKDSIDQVTNQISLTNVLFSGYIYQKSYKEKYFRFEPIIEDIQYNTVEGAVLNLKSAYSKSRENILKYRFTPELRYGFSSKKLYSRLRSEVFYNPHKFSRASITFGKFVSQYNRQNPISPIINTVETLFNRRNYLKLYEKTFFKLAHQSEVVNGILLTSNIEYARRRELANSQTYSFFKENDRDFTPNRPTNNELITTAFEPHSALIAEVNLKIRFHQQYITRPDRKFIMFTKYPRLSMTYRKGIPLFGSDVDFDEVSANVKDEMNYGLFGKGDYSLTAGTFINTDKAYFQDFRHFNGNQTIYGQFRSDYFQLLPYYDFSTTEPWIMGHYIHHFNGFLINKLPLLRHTKVQVVTSAHFLHSSASNTYFEYGIGIEHIFKIFRIDYYTAFQDGSNFANGIRFGIGF